jgi:hypothetical protein
MRPRDFDVGLGRLLLIDVQGKAAFPADRFMARMFRFAKPIIEVKAGPFGRS